MRRAQRSATRGLNFDHNHLRKAVFKGAATTVIVQHKEHPLRAGYQHPIDGGTKPPLAKVTLARRIAATALPMRSQRSQETGVGPEESIHWIAGLVPHRDRDATDASPHG